MKTQSCLHCSAPIVWYKMDGRRIPIEYNPDPNGALAIDRIAGTCRRAVDGDTVRYRSHLLVCKKLAHALHNGKTIKLQAKRISTYCDRDDCELDFKHLHCFKCGSPAHLANVCEEERDNDTLHELDFKHG